MFEGVLIVAADLDVEVDEFFVAGMVEEAFSGGQVDGRFESSEFCVDELSVLDFVLELHGVKRIVGLDVSVVKIVKLNIS